MAASTPTEYDKARAVLTCLITALPDGYEVEDVVDPGEWFDRNIYKLYVRHGRRRFRIELQPDFLAYHAPHEMPVYLGTQADGRLGLADLIRSGRHDTIVVALDAITGA